MSTKRLVFVAPRYGLDIGGGAETLVRQLATRVARAGAHVEVLTTCARDHRTWQNDLSPADEIVDGVVVHRFRVDPRDTDIWVPLQIQISEGMQPDIDQQFRWLEEGVNSSAMYRWIAERGPSYDALIFAPYLFGTTFWGSLIHPERSILIPCLHDEHYAYLDVMRGMFRAVRGCIFNASPEQQLAERLYGPIAGGEVGMGFDQPAFGELEPFFSDGTPYLLYVGRKEMGKGAHELIDRFVELRGRLPNLDIKLVIAGGGSFDDLGRPAAKVRSDIVDLTHLAERDKLRLMRHAVALVQPSVNESFSIVLMESWLQHTPVIVNARCAVTATHVRESGGGLFYADGDDFVAIVERLLADGALRRDLGRAGAAYVHRVYSWDSVMERFWRVVESILKPLEFCNGGVKLQPVETL